MTKITLIRRGLSPFLVAAVPGIWGVVGSVSVTADVDQPLAGDQAEQVARVEGLLANAKKAIGGVRDYQGVLFKQELFGDELVAQWIRFKFSKPFKVYIKYLKPLSGEEAIYVRGWNNNKIRGHKGSFPDIPVNLNPVGRRAMENNHHPITSFGIETILRITTRNIRRGIKRGHTTVAVSDGGLVHGEPVWRIDTKFGKGGRTFAVKKGEDLWRFADRVGQNMYVILHHNDNIDSPTDISQGDEVFVPYYYGSRGEHYISKSTYMLVKAKSWDHQGRLYESYEYPELKLNPGLDQWDFDPRNQEYNFSDQR